MNPVLRTRLSLMMFLQFFVWGAWFVTLAVYMAEIGFGDVIGLTYANQGIAAIVAPLLIGAIADRFFPAQIVMGVLHLVGAVIMYWATTITGDADLFRWAILAYFICYMPTLPLSNTIAFNVIDDVEARFPGIRVWGTIGWIVAGVVIGSIAGAAATDLPMMMAAGGSLLLGLYCFTLPATPPRAKGEPFSPMAILGLDILKSAKSMSFIVFIVCSTLVAIPLSFYYAYTNLFLVDAGATVSLFGQTFEPAAIQTLGQVSEVGFMLLLPLFFRRFGIKWVMVIGMLAWAARYLCFAYGIDTGAPVIGLLLLGILLHGVCYDFFFVAGQIYVDTIFTPAQRARAQSFLALMTLGVGNVIGSAAAGAVVNANSVGEVRDWTAIWLIPAGLAAAVAVLFVIAFRDRRAEAAVAAAG